MKQMDESDSQTEFDLKEKAEEFTRSEIKLDEASPELIFVRLQRRQTQYDLYSNRLNW